MVWVMVIAEAFGGGGDSEGYSRYAISSLGKG